MYNTYILVSVASVETRIMCMFLHYTVALVPGDPLRRYSGHLNYFCPLYIICASVRLNSVQCLQFIEKQIHLIKYNKIRNIKHNS
jgi:hypothetical protein